MEPQSQVLTAEVEFEGETYFANYLVEDNIIRAEIGGVTISKGHTDEPAEQLVQALLLHFLQQSKSTLKNWVPWEGL